MDAIDEPDRRTLRQNYHNAAHGQGQADASLIPAKSLVLVDVRLLRVLLHGFLDRFGLFDFRQGPFGGRVVVGVGMDHLRLLPRLHFFHGSRGWVLSVMLLFLKDFLIVGYIAWIGHAVESPLVIRLAGKVALNVRESENCV